MATLNEPGANGCADQFDQSNSHPLLAVLPPGEISIEEDEEPKARQFMTVFENFRSVSAAAAGFTL